MTTACSSPSIASARSSPGRAAGDVLKESVSRPVVVAQMQALGARLRWHGALDFDFILRDGDPGRPLYIDANPRLVEPVSAYLSGVDLGAALLRVAQGEAAEPLAIGRAGVRTRLGLPGLMERAVATGRRSAVARGLIRATLPPRALRRQHRGADALR